MEKDSATLEDDMRSQRARTKDRIKAHARERAAAAAGQAEEQEEEAEDTSVSPLQLPGDEAEGEEPTTGRSTARRLSTTPKGRSK